MRILREKKGRGKILRAAVLGGTGYIGTALVRCLHDDHVHTVLLVHKKEPNPHRPGCSTLVRGSIAGIDWDEAGLETCDAVFHLARMPGRGMAGRILSSRKGRRANERLVGHLAKMDRPPLLVYVAGTLAYGSCGERRVNEDCSLRPVSYAREYLRAEEPVQFAVESGKLPGMILRPAWVIGRGSWFGRFFLSPMKNRGYVPLYGRGGNWMSFIHVEDCARLAAYYAGCGTPGQTYNLFSGMRMRQEDFCGIISAVTGLPVKKEPMLRFAAIHGIAPAEALASSLFADTIHGDLWSGFAFRHGDMEAVIREIWNGERG